MHCTCLVLIDADGRKQAKRELVDDATQQLHPAYTSTHHRSSKPAPIITGHHRVASSYHHDVSSRPGATSDYSTSAACRLFVDSDVKQSRTSSDTCRQGQGQLTSSGGDIIADEMSGVVSPQCQYIGHASALQPPPLPPPSYTDQLYYAARAGPAGSAMATGSGTAPAGLYNPYDPVVAAGLHRLQQAGHMMGSPCALSATASPLSGGYTGSAAGGYYAGLMAAGSARAAGGSPYVGNAGSAQYHCAGVPYAASTHHQMSSLMNLAGSAAAAACITPPSPQPAPRMQPFVSNSSL